jgi:hypothetical protein
MPGKRFSRVLPAVTLPIFNVRRLQAIDDDDEARAQEAAKEIGNSVSRIGLPAAHAVSGLLLTAFGCFARTLSQQAVLTKHVAGVRSRSDAKCEATKAIGSSEPWMASPVDLAVARG